MPKSFNFVFSVVVILSLQLVILMRKCLTLILELVITKQQASLDFKQKLLAVVK